jgi:hypothetical protein
MPWVGRHAQLVNSFPGANADFRRIEVGALLGEVLTSPLRALKLFVSEAFGGSLYQVARTWRRHVSLERAFGSVAVSNPGQGRYPGRARIWCRLHEFLLRRMTFALSKLGVSAGKRNHLRFQTPAVGGVEVPRGDAGWNVPPQPKAAGSNTGRDFATPGAALTHLREVLAVCY